MPTPMAVVRFVAGHSRPLREVAGAPGHLAGQQARHLAQVGGDAYVDHDNLSPGLGGECINDRAASQEVGHHLAGDLLRPGRDPLRVDAVITGEHRDGGRLGQRRRAPAGQPGQLDRDVLEHAERADGLGQLRLALPRGGQRIAVKRPHGLGDLVEQTDCGAAGKLTLAIFLGVHRPAERAPAGPACQLELRLRRKARDVADA